MNTSQMTEQNLKQISLHVENRIIPGFHKLGLIRVGI